MRETHLCLTCPQPVLVFTGNATTVQAQMDDVNWTPVLQVTLGTSVSARHLPVASTNTSAMHTLTATLVRARPSEFTH